MTGYGAPIEHPPALIEHPTFSSELDVVIIKWPQFRHHMDFHVEGINIASTAMLSQPIPLLDSPPFDEGQNALSDL